MENSELIEFAKWFIHSRRKTYNPTSETMWFASDLMVELCANHPFEKEHRLIVEWNEYKKQMSDSK